MKKDDDQFDDFLRNKLPDTPLDFEPQYWHKAQELISKERANKKRFGLFMLIAIISSVSFIAFNFHTSSHHKTALYQAESQENTPSSENIITPVPTHSVSNLDIQESNDIDVYVTQEATEIIPQQNLKPISLQQNIVTPKSNNNASSSNLLSSNISSSNILSNNILSDNISNNNTPYSLSNDKVLVNPTATEYPDHEITPRLVSGVQIPTRLIKQIDFPTYNINELIEFTSQRQINKRHFTTLEAGLTYYNAKTFSVDPLNFYVLAKRVYNLNGFVSVSAGIGYSRLHQSEGKREYQKVSYDFDKVIEVTGINTIRLDYIELPVNIYYHLQPKHHLSVGASIAYLIQSEDLIKQQTDLSYSQNVNGYYAPYQRFDATVNLGYSYLINTKWIGSISYHQGLIDITKNTPFKSDTYNTNSGLRIGLGYQFK
jgi:hypothetical protein